MIRRRYSSWFLPLLAILAWPCAVSAAEGPLAGYLHPKAFDARIAAMGKSPRAKVQSLGKTRAGLDLWMITVGEARPDRPAVLLLGSPVGPHLVGDELALRMAERLAAAEDESTRAALEQVVFYVIPRPSPEAAARCFERPTAQIDRNSFESNDDRDREINEDGADDLNGDGWITTMRVKTPEGEFRPHPHDPRVMIQGDPVKNEPGGYALYVEGRDDDGDDRLNEDGRGGVSINHNFPHNYKPYDPRAGLHPASEPETRLIIDFALDHPEIALVYSFSPSGNLFHPWKPNGQAEKNRIKTTILSADAGYHEFLAKRYQEIHGGQDAPSPEAVRGALSEWAYFHYGRWSLAARGWWIPKLTDDELKQAGLDKLPDTKAGREDLQALQWFAAQKIDGFVPWAKIKHPDFPGREVEVGGFKPLYRLNPPADRLNRLAGLHLKHLTETLELFPVLAFDAPRCEAKSLGGGVVRVKATLLNTGYLPTMSAMGKLTRQVPPLQIALALPEDAKLLQGTPRRQIDPLTGQGGSQEQTWLVRLMKPAGELEVQAWSPVVGRITTKLKVR